MKKTSIFVEFFIQDFERIRNLQGFLDVIHYPDVYADHIHRREFGWIETEDTLIRFLAYQPERLSGLESEMTMRQSEQDNERS